METPMSNLSMEELQISEAPPIFTELFELYRYEDGYQEWKEISRWIKFEEDVEEAGNRWSKPHVSTPSLRGWLQLRQAIRTGLVLIDVEAKDFGQILDAIGSRLVCDHDFTTDNKNRLKDLWSKKHRHQFEGPRKMEGNLSRVIKDLLVQKLENKNTLRVPADSYSQPGSRRGSITVTRNVDGELGGLDDGKVNVALQKKISSSTEAAVILEGVVNFIESPVSVFVRLAKPVVLGDLPEVDIPTRFLYFFLGPPSRLSNTASLSTPESDIRLYADIGISLATAITDKTFSCAIFNAKTKTDIVDALDAYTNNLKILPGEYNTELNKIEPPSHHEKPKLNTDEDEEIDEDRRMREASGLVRSGKLLGGLFQDIKRKKQHYVSDFMQGFHPQCISSFLFLYFACLAPIVAFGALLGDATENRIATIESLMSGLISGVIFGLFAGQPLIILGSTGPVYVFEKILYQICTDQNWDYLSLRLWIGIWVGIILIIMVVFDASAIVCYITRFTEELFATLIAFIFIFNAVKNLFAVGYAYEFKPKLFNLSDTCVPTEEQFYNDTIDWRKLTQEECSNNNGKMILHDGDYEPNVFLMSIVLFFGTFVISFTLKNFRNTGYLPGNIRNLFSDFAVVIAIFSMTTVSYLSDVHTEKLVVPSEFKPTWEGREWIITHALIFADHLLTNPWWVDVFLAPVLALLATILIFMDQQITAVIVNRKEHKLKKGGGYHLDLLVLACIIIICSVFGLPWFVAATVLSINHIQSLTKESESSAPGDKPQFLGIREQRVTAIMIAIAIGLSTFITPVLAIIPMPVLYGVFLFMGVSSLKGLQFFDRILLLFMPRKYQPDYIFLKHVPLHRVHLFTLFQLTSLIGLWIIKSNPSTSIAFPVMLVVICAIRKFLECVFSRRELRVLDDLLPESSSNKVRRHGGSIFKKINRSGWEEDEEMEQEMKREQEQDAERAMLLQNITKAKAFGSELDDYSRVDIRAKTKSFNAIARARNRSNSVQPFKEPKPKTLIFAKLSNQKVFTPLNLNTRTVNGLLRRLEGKFPSIKMAAVANVYRSNQRNLLFHLDDDMVEFIQANEVFDIEVSPNEEFPEKIDITLQQIESGI